MIVKYSVFGYLIGEGLRNVFKNKKSTIASLMIMCATMFVFGIFFLIGQNVQSVVKQVEEQQFHFALSIFKDFSTGCYQITIGMNDPVCRFLDDGTEQLISSVKFLYQEDYPVVILDAEMMLQNLEKNTFNPRKYHACAIRVYDCPRFELTEEERNGSIVIRGGQPFIILGNGHNWITRVAPDKNWIPPENGCVQFQMYQVKV